MEKLYSRYLMEEHPISFHPTLAQAIGLNEAIMLQKINLWLNCKPKEAEGRSWIYNSYKSWQEQLPFWSESTIRRTLKSLEDKQLIIVGNFNKMKLDKTKWYSIDYEKLDKIVDDVKMGSPSAQIEQTNCSNWTEPCEQIEQSNTNEYIMNTNNDISNNPNLLLKEDKQELLKHFNLIWEQYPNKKGKAKSIEYFFEWIKGRKISGTTIKLTDEQMYKAVIAYRQECEKNKTELQYIKHGDTFFNKAILDYVED